MRMTLALKLLATAFVALALIHADQPAGGFFAGAFIACLLLFSFPASFGPPPTSTSEQSAHAGF
jgi:hypothetical protein